MTFVVNYFDVFRENVVRLVVKGSGSIEQSTNTMYIRKTTKWNMWKGNKFAIAYGKVDIFEKMCVYIFKNIGFDLIFLLLKHLRDCFFDINMQKFEYMY